ncbi:MAG: response regulator transcription factor [Eubacteriales bacterium]|jgi:DNA-binding response OmpR family regulator|nr:response regulator transcription factor [Eubacteriales bacterium]MDD3572069.1 response regulator transcription factor [Eubacteriales bacterium]MDD4135197.1 response regulator transcription factor [Eubacteriales bacterium]NLO12888.1 response regulator transcription factor [Clostridiales bacterium]
MTNILIADDNQQIASVLEEYLKKEGYIPYRAKDGVEALEMFHQLSPDAILLDVMMPKLDGFAVCREIRKISTVPIIMVTARGEDFERIMGLDTGADDYIVKPFSPGELMARLRAVLRRMDRGQTVSGQSVALGNLRVDLDTYTARIDGREVALTRKELELLFTMASHRDKVFSRENLLESIWGYEYFGDSRTVDSHIKRLRSKLDAYGPRGWEIKTIWGVGYKLEGREDEE